MAAWVNRMNLRQKLILMFVFFIVLPILVIDGIIAIRVEGATQDQVGKTMLQLVKANHLTLDRVLMSMDEATQRLMNAQDTQQMLVLTELSESDRFERFIRMDTLLSQYSTTEFNYSLFIPDEQQTYFFTPDPNTRTGGVFYIRSFRDYNWFLQAYADKGKGSLMVIRRFGINPSGEHTLAYLRQMNSISQGDKPIGTLVVTGMDTALRRDMATVNLPPKGKIMLLNENNAVLSGTGTESLGQPAPIPPQVGLLQDQVATVKVDGAEWMFVTHHSEDSRTKLLYAFPLSAILSEHASIQRMLHVVMLLYFVLLFLAIIFFFREILRPLSRLASYMRAYEPGRQLPRIGLRRKDEIGILSERFEQMTERLNQTIHDKYMLEIKQIETELTILQSQINPHLLYNTLESIYWKTTFEGAPESAEMIKDLSMLMRIGLSSGKLMIPIREELTHLEAYLRLQLKRHDYSYRIVWSIEEQAAGYLIPKVILQPLAENSILHGIKHMGSEGELYISVRLEGERVRIDMEDNGFKPVDYDRIGRILREELPNGGYGIRNVEKRIKLHYGEQYGLRYAPRPGGGTIVTLIVPAVDGEAHTARETQEERKYG